MANPFAQFHQEDNPFAQFNAGAGEPAKSSPRDFGIDYSLPVDAVRSKIAELPETDRADANKQWASQYVKRERKDGGIGQALSDTARNLARGTIIGGWADEANAFTQDLLWKAGIGGSPYDEALAYQRATDAAIEKEMPVTSAVTQLVGGVASGAPLFLKPGATVASNVIRGVPYGAAYGYSSGFSNAEGGDGDLSEQMARRHQSGAKAAGIGAMIGPALPLVTAGAQRGIGMAMDAVAPRAAQMWHGTPEAAANKILARKIDQTGRTPQQIVDDLAEGRRVAELSPGSRSTLPEMIGDTTDSLQRLSGTVYRQGGKGAEDIKGALDRRQRGVDNPYAPRDNATPQGQLERILDDVERVLQIKSSKSARRTERELLAEQKAIGDDLYKKARDQSEEFDLTPTLDGMSMKTLDYPLPFQAKLREAIDLFTQPANPKAAEREQAVFERMRRLQEDEDLRLSRARSDAEIERISEDYAIKQQRAMEDLNRIRFQNSVLESRRFPVTDVKRFDAAKQALDDVIEKAEGNLQRELTQFKHDLLARVHEYDAKGMPTKNKIYQDARDTWGSRAENRNAIDLGRAALREGSEVTAEQFRELTKGQHKLFRIGLRESIYKDRLGSKSPGDDVTKVFQKRNVQDLMSEVIPQPRSTKSDYYDRPERFGEVLRREARMVQHRNQTLGNSSTPQRTGDDAEYAANAMGELWNRFRGSPTLTNMAFEAVSSVLRRVTAYRQDVADAMARRLMSSDPAEQVKYLREIEAALGKNKFEQFIDEMDRAAASLGRSIETQVGIGAARTDGRSRETAGNLAESRLLSQARNALRRGADRAKVEERLRSMGVNPGKL